MLGQPGPLTEHNHDSEVSGVVRATERQECDDWHINFTIPELSTFSHHVQNAITTGIVTGRARREIVQVLRTYITAHTSYPTPEQYQRICRMLVLKYPVLKDLEGTT